MKKLHYILLFLFAFPSCKSPYIVEKTNINLDAYTNSKYKKGLIISALDEETNFYSLYYTEIKNKSKLGNLIKFQIKNRKDFYHMSNGIYLPISNEFYFTSNNKITGNLQLYKCDINNFNLFNPKLINLDSEKLSYGHCAFLKNGLSMIISSNEANQIKLKLYARQNLNSDWYFKRNLDELNIKQKNYHPVLINDNTIVYSQRDKKRGDLFSSKLKEDNYWSSPKKIKNLIHSKEKINYILITDRTGYFTAKRDEKDEIFYFELAKGRKNEKILRQEKK
ncbi:hypothetical protein F7018_03480 [Tenacibaculum aiptasiae]|uniref:Uncharacterized protein n=1 Tax=Tenacibaculum aiptasiae TaxID=426481 RepID=A0A7J5AP39_9FLAO|nr:hypothetical protein [Tenacibaculum aiptasiae]KAB1159386.1 hypothetical protein F7018_03480 [Tenacibaculum aiptasiae]